jgi:circadian clock protein KaiC
MKNDPHTAPIPALTIREFRPGKNGAEAGPALTDFEGVLTGVTSCGGRQHLLGDNDGARRR